jgi:hypothetical protein
VDSFVQRKRTKGTKKDDERDYSYVSMERKIYGVCKSIY